LVTIADSDDHVNRVEAELINIKRVVKRHPACDVMCVSRRKRMTPRMDWTQGKKTPWRVPSFSGCEWVCGGAVGVGVIILLHAAAYTVISMFLEIGGNGTVMHR